MSSARLAGIDAACLMASEINDHPLDRSRPLWEIVVVEGLANGEVALIAKLHHSMMDGMVGVRYLAALLGSNGAAESPSPSPAEPAPSDVRLLAEALPELMEIAEAMEESPAELARALGPRAEPGVSLDEMRV